MSSPISAGRVTGNGRASGSHITDSSDDASSNRRRSDRGPLNPVGESATAAAESERTQQQQPRRRNSRTSTTSSAQSGWLVTSCDVGTAEPQSLSQELERLQVLKSYHMMDSERDESIDRLTRMASAVLDTPYTFLSLVDMGRIWFRCNQDSDSEQQLTRDMLSSIARVIMRHDTVFDVPDTVDDEMFQKNSADNTNSSSSNNNNHNSATTNSIPTHPRFRFFAGAPLMSPEGYRLGAFCMLDTQPRPGGATEFEKENLLEFGQLMVKAMVDRRKLTTQGSPSHLVACTAHDLITPLTGIQLSLSLLQQDGDFQAKLGEKRREFTSAAVRSSNMMLRICQSTIETLRGNRKIPSSSNDFSLPRNIMHLAEASPFIDMKEFTANLEAISNSIPKRVPLTITLHPSTPTNIVSDGLKIFRSALNLLSNACTRANSGFISLTIFDDEDGSLMFECEDTGKDVEVRDSQTLFSQDIDNSNFGLYSVAYQINWLGGKYGVRKRGATRRHSGGTATATLINGAHNSNHSGVSSGGAQAGSDNTRKKGAIFWFSIPIVLPQDVSELMGLAKSLSGKNEVTSVPTFKASLPSTPPASPIIEEKPDSESPTTLPEGEGSEDGVETTRTLNALIIEDSTTVRKILGRALSKLGYQVFEAVDGMEGLRELKATMFDMVLCDFLMPVMDGLDCVQQYREWEAKNGRKFRQYIIGISAHASRNDIERGLNLGMDDFKPKPIVLKTLTELHESASLKAVRSALDRIMNLPSFDAKKRAVSRSGSDNGNKKTRFTLPAETKSPKKATHFSIPVASVAENAKSPSLFVVPKTPSELQMEAEGGDKPAALFSIPPRRTTESVAKSPPLFSLGGTGSSNPTRKDEPKQPIKPALFAIPDNGRTDKSSKSLFSIPVNTSRGDEAKTGTSSRGGLFSISVNPSSADGTRKPALFSIPINPGIDAKTREGAAKKSAALFSIPINPTHDSKQETVKKPALFSIAINPTAESSLQTTKKPALFSISVNPTSGGDEQRPTSAQKPTPLFAIPETRGTGGGIQKKPSPLFSIPTAQNKANREPAEEKKPSPLFSIPQSDAKKRAPLFANPASQDTVNKKQERAETKPAPLFSIPTSSGGKAVAGKKQTPLFSTQARTSPKNIVQKQQTTREKRPVPLFSIGAGSIEKQQDTEAKQHPPLFSIQPSDAGAATKPAPLFAIPATGSATSVEKKNSTEKQHRPLSGAKQGAAKAAPLFAIQSTLRTETIEEQQKADEMKPAAPLFSIPHAEAVPRKPAPLFAVAATPASDSSSGEKQNTEEKNHVPLFSDPTITRNAKKRPLSSLPGNANDKDQSTPKKAALFSIVSTGGDAVVKKPAPLFSTPRKPTTGVGEDKSGANNRPLFSIPTTDTGSGGDKKPFDRTVKADAHAKQAARPPLFQIPGKSANDDSNANQSNGSDVDSRPQRALFDIGTGKR